MKPRYEDHEVISTLQGETIQFGLDPTATKHLMGLLSDLYKYPERAVLREYATNALDAHVEIGNTAPVEIELPNVLEPVLRIIDHGPGLSRDDMRRVYTQYGASTKRDSDDYVGILGVGSKAAVSYTKQYTIRSVKNGVRCVLSVSRTDEGITMTKVEQVRCDDPSGVTIAIPVRSENNFAKEAADLFQYWPEGSILVDGQPPKRFEGKEIAPGIFLIPGNKYHSQSVVVQGNVPYPVSLTDLGLNFGDGYGTHAVVAYVPMGTVDFMNHREALDMAKVRTKTVLSDIGQAFLADLVIDAQDEIDGSLNRMDALRSYLRLRNSLPHAVVQELRNDYKGKEFPTTYHVDTEQVSAPNGPPHYGSRTFKGIVQVSYWDNGAVYNRTADRQPQEVLDSIWFYGFTTKHFTKSHRAKLEQWKEAQGFDPPKHFLLSESKPNMVWLDRKRVLPWEVILNQKLPKAHREPGEPIERLTGAYDVIRDSQENRAWSTEASRIPTDEPILYFVAKEIANKHSRYEHTRAEQAGDWVRAARVVHPKCSVVCLPETRLKKFLKAFPGALEIKQFVADQFKLFEEALTDDQKAGLAIHQDGVASELRELSRFPIDDPAIATACRIASLPVDGLASAIHRYSRARHLIDLPEWENPLLRYPLWSHMAQQNHGTHVVLYLNEAYRALIKE